MVVNGVAHLTRYRVEEEINLNPPKKDCLGTRHKKTGKWIWKWDTNSRGRSK